MQLNVTPDKIAKIAEDLSSKGQPDRAIEMLIPVVEQHPKIARVRMVLGRAYLKLHEFSKAENCIQPIFEFDPFHQYAHWLHSNILCKRGENSLALLKAKKLIVQKPDVIWPLEILMGVYHSADQGYLILPILNKILERQPALIKIIKRKFWLLNKLNKKPEAILFLKDKLLVVDDPWIHEQLIAPYITDDPDKALIELKDCSVKYPDYFSFTLNIARIAERRGDYEEAVIYLQKQYTVKKIEIGLNILRLYFENEQYESFEIFLEKIIIDFPKNTLLMQRVVTFYLKIGDASKVQLYLRKLQRIDPNCLSYFQSTAKLLIQLGLHAEALYFYEKGKEFHSKNIKYWQHYLYLSDRAYQPLIFEKVKGLILSKLSNEFDLMKALASKSFHVGNSQEAIEIINRCNVVERVEKSARSAFIAWAQLHDMSLKEAYENFSYAIDLDPDTPSYFLGRAHAAILSPLYRQARSDFVQYQKLLLKTGKDIGHPLGDYYGQMLNEMEGNPNALRQLEELFIEPNLQGFDRLIQQEPEYTPGHAYFCMFARNKGVFKRQYEYGKTNKIPKNIFQFWDTKEMPADIEHLTSTWQEHHVGWHYQRFNEDQAIVFLASEFNKSVVKAFIQAPFAAMKSDLFRLAALYKYGGVYADADDLCIKPLDTLLSSGKSLYLYQEYVGSMGNNFIAVTAKHRLIRLALKQAVENILDNEFDYVWLATGPGLITRCFAKMLIADMKKGRNMQADWHILSVQDIHEYSQIHCHVEYKATAQHWVNMK
jgi:mannosyltransferase OCH1-like enzyme